MRRAKSAFLSAGIVWLGLTAGSAAQRAPVSPPVKPVAAHVPSADPKSSDPAAHTGTVRKYCATCHSDRGKAGGLSLAAFDVSQAGQNAEVAERMIRKLRAGMMPPPGAARPDAETLTTLATTLETKVDTIAAAHPNPGGRPFQRLNRPEYARAIRDLLALDVNAGDWLPLDQKSANFDNIADSQALSPLLLEAYLNAAATISRMAVGDRNAPTVDSTYTSSTYVSQHPWDHVEGAPFGTRGGIVVDHVFPADAEYVFTMMIASGDNSRFEDIDVSVDGERVALVEYENGPAAAADGSGGDYMRTEPILVRAGQHKVAAAFVRKLEGPYEDLIRPHEWSFAGGGSGGGGITTLPHLRNLIVKGPYRVTGISDTPSREKIFSCRPTVASEERSCARTIVSRLGNEAYRRPLSDTEMDRLMPFYEKGAAKGGFEMGIRGALEAILASPYFIFRLEREPENAKPGRLRAPGRATASLATAVRDANRETALAGRVAERPDGAEAGNDFNLSDWDLASRVSFFLWGTPPDKDLLAIAARGELATVAGLEQQTRRMLADPRADALGSRFAAQWLRLQDIDKVKPDPNFFPNFDENLAAAMQEETVRFFNNLVREDQSVLELYRAPYTFVNERLARHYGFPNIAGEHFRRVTYPDDKRRGLMGQGSVLVLTSLANRTSPVLRGKWVMEVLLGTPPPPPPPDVPPLEDTQGAKDGKMLTTRERMELHRKNPTCNSCHRFMDPIGLALDNFDVTAKWRVRENGMPLDTAGDFYDGTKVTTLAELSNALMKRPVPLVRTFTENLLAYALGRRVEYYDQPTVRAIAKAAEGNDYKMSSFVLGVVKSDAFRMKRNDATSTTEETKTAVGQR